MSEFETATNFFALLTVAANVAVIACWIVVVGARWSTGLERLATPLRAALGQAGLALAAGVALFATAGSLYLSERLDLVPCTLCWYQRIAMYSLALVLLVAAVRHDWAVRPYALALGIAGPLVSMWHYVEQRFPDVGSGTCDPTNPCTITYVWRFGYVSIPFMALSAFILVVTILLVATPDVRPEAT